MRTRIPSGPVFDTAGWRGRVRACGSRRGERRVGGHGSRAAGAARESTPPVSRPPAAFGRRRGGWQEASTAARLSPGADGASARVSLHYVLRPVGARGRRCGRGGIITVVEAGCARRATWWDGRKYSLDPVKSV